MSKHRTIKILAVAALLLALIPGVLTAAQWVDAPLIRLQYASFDPLAGGEPFIPAGLSTPVEAAGSGLYLLQFEGPVQESWKADVQAAGAQLYGYIPDFTFLARMETAAVEKITALEHVRWVGDYHPAYRMSPALNEMVPAGENFTQSRAPLDIMVQTAPDADLSALSELVLPLEGEVYATANGYLRVVMPAGNVTRLAASGDVFWIEPYFEPEYYNDKGGTEIMHAGAVHTLGYTGAGQIVAIADSGLDTGDTNNLHPDFGGRLIKAYCLGRPSPCDWSDFVSHGTHVAGSVLGNGSASGGQYKGTAPDAQLVFQSLADSSGGLDGIPADEGDLMRDAYVDGARIHTNSWGGPSGGSLNQYGGYVIFSQQVDQAMWEHKDMLVLFSAGNNGADLDKNGLIDDDSIGQPGTAKNVLTVGASENNRPSINNIWGSNYGAPIQNDLRADNPDGLAAFSSRGPTDDGRIKPDVVAPGTFIASTRTRQYVFNDNLEGGTSGYSTNVTSNGGAGSWSLQTGDAHSPTHYWKETVNSGSSGAVTYMLTPPMDIRPTGGVVDLHFYHKYALSSGEKLVVLIFDASNLNANDGYILGESGSSSSYHLRSLLFSNAWVGSPSSVRFGFGIQTDGSPNSTWQIDDIRVDGADWGTMSSVGLAPEGSLIDESYLMMGGTSMSTPLTAGAAAVVREWLTTGRGFSNPSAALMKAAIVNGAADMSPGQYTSPQEIPVQRPNNAAGWGRVDLLESINPPYPRQVWLRDDTAGLNTGASATYNFTLSAPTTALESAAESGGYTLENSEPAQATPEPPGAAPQATPEAFRVAPSAPDLGNAPLLPMKIGGSPATAEGITQLLANPGFESSGTWTTDQTARTTAQAFAGSYSMGSTPAVDGAFYQSVAFPTDAISSTLTFKLKNDPRDVISGACYDYIQVVVWDSPFNNVLGSSPALCFDTNLWGTVTLDFNPILNSLKGQTVNLVFYTLQDDIVTHAVFYVDETYWNVEIPGADPTPTATVPGPTATATPTTTPGGEDLRVSLAWTDYPGNPVTSGPQLVNDLDLEVIAPNGTHYYGNAGTYASGQCLRGGTWDACNNLEGVIVPNAPYGTYTVIVHAYNAPQGPQPFALVASGENILGTAPNLDVHLYLPMITR